jgi:hypothetical protein
MVVAKKMQKKWRSQRTAPNHQQRRYTTKKMELAIAKTQRVLKPNTTTILGELMQ